MHLIKIKYTFNIYPDFDASTSTAVALTGHKIVDDEMEDCERGRVEYSDFEINR